MQAVLTQELINHVGRLLELLLLLLGLLLLLLVVAGPAGLIDA